MIVASAKNSNSPQILRAVELKSNKQTPPHPSIPLSLIVDNARSHPNHDPLIPPRTQLQQP